MKLIRLGPLRLRQGASAALMKMPTPLPGLGAPSDLLPLLSWSLDLLWSPRQRESDAAARMLKLICDKYVLGLNWTLQLSPELRIEDGKVEGGSCHLDGPFLPCLSFLESLLSLIEIQLEVRGS